MNNTRELILPQREAISVDPDAARVVEDGLQYMKHEGLAYGVLGGLVLGMVLAWLGGVLKERLVGR